MNRPLDIPLFPLHTVLFPGGPLALRVFEARYLDMISRCLRDESPFGIVLIRSGDEVGDAAEVHEVGTLARISYWERRNDGLLGVTVRGERRFRVLDTEVRPDRLLTARVENLAEPESTPVPERFSPLVELLQGLMERLDHPYVTLPREFEDANWVTGRLIELLPLENERKQELLTRDDPIDRLRELAAIMAAGTL